MSLVQLNGSQETEVRTYWYAGTDALKEGYLLCFDDTATFTATDPKTRQTSQVVKPATNNLMYFAGVVSPTSDGRTGPCFVDVILPLKGTIAKVMTETGSTLRTSYLQPQNGSYAGDVQAFSATTFGVAMESNGSGGDLAKFTRFL